MLLFETSSFRLPAHATIQVMRPLPAIRLFFTTLHSHIISLAEADCNTGNPAGSSWANTWVNVMEPSLRWWRMYQSSQWKHSYVRRPQTQSVYYTLLAKCSGIGESVLRPVPNSRWKHCPMRQWNFDVALIGGLDSWTFLFDCIDCHWLHVFMCCCLWLGALCIVHVDILHLHRMFQMIYRHEL